MQEINGKQTYAYPTSGVCFLVNASTEAAICLNRQHIPLFTLFRKMYKGAATKYTVQ